VTPRPAPLAAALRRHAPTAAVLAAATLVSNVLAYALYLVLNRTLTTDDLGATAALLNLVVISTVLALAVQLIAARHVATGRSPGRELVPAPGAAASSDQGDPAASAIANGALLGLAVTAVMLAASPFVAAAFDLDGILPAALVALVVLPTYLTYAAQGCLHGRERFGALGLVFIAVAVGRFAAGAGAAVAGLGVTGVLGLTVVAAWLTAGLALALVPGGVRTARHHTDAAWVRAVLHGATATSALLVVTNMDIPLARTFLTAAQSGEYAVVALFSKAAYWGPAFLATLFYPRMARATTRRSVLLAMGSTAAVAALGILAAALLAEPLVRLVGGPGYVHLAPLVPLLTATGAVWSVAQVLVYWRLSRGDHRLGYAVWTVAAAVAAVVVLWRHESVSEIASTVLLGGLTVVAYGLVQLARTPGVSERRRARSGRPPR
jgi:O-antigen/teichoic acid export membrane protein